MGDTPSILDGRILVVAFEGWNDAGDAASSAARTLKDALELDAIAELDGEYYFDYQFNRPLATMGEDGNRSIVWPTVTFFAPSASRLATGDPRLDIHVLLGTEPSRSWKSFADDVLEILQDREITAIVTLGSMLADVPHSRPISVFTSSENAALRTELGLERSTYEGPVGILSVIADAAEREGVPTVSVWASVPHYVHATPSPKATLALISRLEELVGVDIPRGTLIDEAAAWEAGINQLASEDDDMASYIEQLERARDTVDSPEASGDAIAEEFEKYLRRHEGGKSDPRS